MNTRVIIIALLGGLLTGPTLNYPLHDYLPATFVPGWPPAQATWAWVLALVGVLVSALTLVIASATSLSLRDSLQDAARHTADPSAYAVEAVIAWPVVTGFAALLLWRALGFWWLGAMTLLLVTPIAVAPSPAAAPFLTLMTAVFGWLVHRLATLFTPKE